MRRRPLSRLFPYTTLFRSSASVLVSSARSALSRASSLSCLASPLPCPTADRKSTRLNSSHLGISYAVFCLKNKSLRTLTPRAGRIGPQEERLVVHRRDTAR